MEISNIYINDDIVYYIFDKLSYEGKVAFSHINRYTYNEYKDTIKYNIFKYINTDYRLYKDCINRYKYNNNEIRDLGIIAIKNMKTVWGSLQTGYYDLRYIFELIMKDLDINDKDIKKINNKLNLQLILQEIKKCKSFNRAETILNISKVPMLHALRYTFKNYDNEWMYI
jgi:hypothetical protein